MARIKTNKTNIYALIDGVVEKISCYASFGFGQDSFGKIDASCLDSDTKDYERGMRDPGEGNIGIKLDDANPSHFKLIALAESGEKVKWFVGSSHSGAAPTFTTPNVTLPDSRVWWSFEGYINPTAPDDFEQDGLIGYSFTLVRTSGVAIQPMTITP